MTDLIVFNRGLASRQNKTFKYYIIYNYSSKQVINNLLFVFCFACYNMRSIINLIQLSSMFRKLLTFFLVILIIALTVNLVRKDGDFSASQSALSIQTQQGQTTARPPAATADSPNIMTNVPSNPTIPITTTVTSSNTNGSQPNDLLNAGGGSCVSCQAYDSTGHFYGASYDGGACQRGLSCNGFTSSQPAMNRVAQDPLIEAMISSNTTIRYGSRGDLVKGLQTFLVNQGYLPAGSKIDGIYGKGTLAAVKSFQTKNSLSADGVVGIGTKSVMGSISANVPIIGNTSGPVELQYSCSSGNCGSVGLHCCAGNGVAGYNVSNLDNCYNGGSAGTVTVAGLCSVN